MRMQRIPFVLVALIAAVLAFSVSSAKADDNSATITKDFGCFIALGGLFAVTGDQTIEVDTSSGNTVLVCHFTAADFISALPTETQHFADFACGTFAGLGTGTFTVNQTGHGVLRCEIKANA